MTSSSMSRALVAMLAIVALSGCKPVDDVMVLIFGRSMRDQRSFDPYENTRPSPENSISFASGNYPLEFGVVNVGQPEGADVPRFTQADLGVPGVGALVVQGLTNPLDRTDPRSMERGEELYMRFCAVCHGDDGVGANAYIADKHPTLPAYNLSGAQVAAYSDQYLYAMIRVGRGLMPEYGSRITHFDRWTIVNYVRELQLQAGNTPGSDASGGGPPAGE
ncbi:MAG TPA: cytochrome c [Gemmatimonadetes bacterium]|nr:cytochrome c [Gemmatimonadota bacterium]